MSTTKPVDDSGNKSPRSTDSDQKRLGTIQAFPSTLRAGRAKIAKLDARIWDGPTPTVISKLVNPSRPVDPLAFPSLNATKADISTAPPIGEVWDLIEKRADRWVAVDEPTYRLITKELPGMEGLLHRASDDWEALDRHAELHGINGADTAHYIAASFVTGENVNHDSVTVATSEQRHIIDLAVELADIAVSALAGTGKTTTLRMISEANPQPTLALMFNAAIAAEANEKLPPHVQAQTIHSLARQTSPDWVQKRSRSPEIRPEALARRLLVPAYNDASTGQSLEPATIAAFAYETVNRFCISADTRIGNHHIPIPPSLPQGSLPCYHNHVINQATRVWEDLRSSTGSLPMSHNHYLKLWAMNNPRIPSRFEVLMFDEAQDANPVMVEILQQNRENTQFIAVGDPAQRIYGFNGAVNSLDLFSDMNSASLTQSFRFGEDIADIANLALRQLGDTSRIIGAEKESTVGHCDEPDAYIARANSTLLQLAMGLSAQQKTYHLEGAEELGSLASSAMKLQKGSPTSHPLFVGFGNWEEVLAAAETTRESDPTFSRLVQTIDDHGASTIANVIKSSAPSGDSTPLLVTAHRSKGREWESVKLLNDFQTGPGIDPEELRIFYVAVTRALTHLDLSGMPLFSN